MIVAMFSSKSPFSSLPLVRILLPVRDPGGHDGPTCGLFASAPAFARCKSVLKRLQDLSSQHLPFVAVELSSNMIQLICSKAIVAKVMKMILLKQKDLGVKVSSNIKEHLELGPIPKRELEEACMWELERKFAGSTASPWWLLTHGHVLERNILHAQPQHPDTPKTNTPIGSFQFSVHLMDPTTLFIIFRPSIVTFRHLPLTFPFHRKQHSVRSGTLCTLLPHLTPAVIQACRVADNTEEADIMEASWRDAGWDVPNGAGKFIVDVRLDLEDEDAPSLPVPFCTVLSSVGLDRVVPSQHHTSSQLSRFVSEILATFSASTPSIPSFLWPAGVWPSPAHVKRGMLLRSPPQPLSAVLDVRLKKASSVDPGDVETYTRQSFATFNAFQPFYCDGLGWVRLLDGEVSPVSPSSPGNNNGRDTCDVLQTTRHTKVRSQPAPELRAYLAKLETIDLETEGQQQTQQQAIKRQQSQVSLLFSSLHSSKLNLKRPKFSKTVTPARNGAVGASELGKGPLLAIPSVQVPTATTNDECSGQIVRAKPSKPNAKTPGKAPANKDKPVGMPVDIDKAVESNQLHSLTVPQLKAACRQLGLPVGGKKADLEQRIRNFKSEC